MDRELNNEILKAIDTVVKQRIKEFQRIDYCEGIIEQKNINNTYDVMVNDETQTVYKINNDIYNIGDVVIILIFKNQRYILTKKDNIVI